MKKWWTQTWRYVLLCWEDVKSVISVYMCYVKWSHRCATNNDLYEPGWFAGVSRITIDSAPSLGVYYFLLLTLSVSPSVCMSVCHTAPSNRFFFFVSRWNRAIFDCHFSMWHCTKRCSSMFDLGPLSPKIYSPKLALWVIESVIVYISVKKLQFNQVLTATCIEWHIENSKNDKKVILASTTSPKRQCDAE